MIIQRCPRCGSGRIRPGYRRTYWWQAIFGRYNLLCNSCNWEFVGLAIPGTVSDQHSRRRKKQIVEQEQAQLPTAQDVKRFAETQELRETIDLEFDNRSSEESAAGDLQSAPINSVPFSDSQSDTDKRFLNIHPKIEATADNNLKPIESEKALNNVSNKMSPAIIVTDKATAKRTKSRKRSKRKK